MKTFKEIRAEFWNAHPQFRAEYRKTWTQDQYRADIRVSFTDYIDHLQKSGEITEKQAYKITL